MPLFILIMVFGIWLSLVNGPFYVSPTCTGRGCTPPVFFAVIGILLTAGVISDVVKARKLEFYEGFVRLIGKGGTSDQDYAYDQVTVGALFKIRFSYNFILSINAPKRPLVFHLRNQRIRGTDQSLYEWMKDTDAEREKLTPEILSAQSAKSKLSYVVPLGILTGIAMIVLGPWVFWSINTPRGTPLIDIEIGVGLAVAGLILIAAILVFRGYQNARYTSH